MELIDLLISGVQLSPMNDLVIGEITAKFRPVGSPFPHEVRLKVRIKGNSSQTFQEIEVALLAEAKSILSQSSHILDGVDPDKLRADTRQRAANEASRLEQEIAAGIAAGIGDQT